MTLNEKVFFGNYPYLIFLYPLFLIGRFIGWLRDPNKFCKHNWVGRKLEKSYGVFGGMEVYECSKCKKQDWDRNATDRLKRNGLL